MDRFDSAWNVEGLTISHKRHLPPSKNKWYFEFSFSMFSNLDMNITFESLMELGLWKITWKTCLIYYDDIIILGKSLWNIR